jgi:hypothetical protein
METLLNINIPSYLFLFMKHLSIILTSLAHSIIMLVPGVSFAMTPAAPPHVTYNFGGQKVAFTGDHVTISMGHHSYHVSWRVYMVTGAHLKQMHLTNISYRRIDTKYQNSAILRENNSYISLAEIFTFGTAMDASIALKNLMKANETYEIAFHMVSENHHSKFQLNGNYPMMDSLNENSMNPETGDAMIPSGDWSMTMGHVKVNWQDEMSIFHVGSVSTNPLSSSLILPFGPITLMGNETYSIDPVIRPSIIHICACSGGGGGSPPSGAAIGTYTDHAYPGQTIYVNSSISSPGSGGNTWYLEAYNYTSGIWETLESASPGSAISHEFEFTLPSFVSATSTDISALRVFVRNAYGSTTSNSVKFYSVSNYPVSLVKPTYYSVNGKEVGAVAASVGGPAAAEPESTDFGLSVNPMYIPDDTSKNYSVNWVNQSITYDSTSASANPALNWGTLSEDIFFYQNYSSTNSSYILDLAAPFASLLSIADPVAGALAGAALSAVIGYEALLNENTQNLHVLNGGNFVYLNYSAGYRPYDGYMCSRFGEDCYNYYYSLGTTYGPSYAPEFANSYTFPIAFTVVQISGNSNIQQSNPAIMELTYSVQMGITLNHIGLFSGPALQLPFYLAYYGTSSI